MHTLIGGMLSLSYSYRKDVQTFRFLHPLATGCLCVLQAIGEWRMTEIIGDRFQVI